MCPKVEARSERPKHGIHEIKAIFVTFSKLIVVALTTMCRLLTARDKVQNNFIKTADVQMVLNRVLQTTDDVKCL